MSLEELLFFPGLRALEFFMGEALLFAVGRAERDVLILAESLGLT